MRGLEQVTVNGDVEPDHGIRSFSFFTVENSTEVIEISCVLNNLASHTARSMLAMGKCISVLELANNVLIMIRTSDAGWLDLTLCKAGLYAAEGRDMEASLLSLLKEALKMSGGKGGVIQMFSDIFTPQALGQMPLSAIKSFEAFTSQRDEAIY